MGVLFFLAGQKLLNKTKTKTTDSTVHRSGLESAQIPAGVAEHAVLGITTINGDTRLTVITTERDKDKLVQLNDVLYPHYNRQIDGSFFIDYFDDRTVADRYFQDIARADLNQNQKSELFGHYSAVMIDIDQARDKQFYVNTATMPVVAKTYSSP